jgi:26S proteasome regulatory subunit N6
MAESLQQKLQAASEAIETQPANAVTQLRDILLGPYPNDAEGLKVKESALDMLAAALVKQKDTAALRALLTDLRPWFGVIPKAKTAKLVRTIIDSIGKIPDSTQILVSCIFFLLFFKIIDRRTSLPHGANALFF